MLLWNEWIRRLPIEVEYVKKVLPVHSRGEMGEISIIMSDKNCFHWQKQFVQPSAENVLKMCCVDLCVSQRCSLIILLSWKDDNEKKSQTFCTIQREFGLSRQPAVLTSSG